ncbi:F0F1 ATP synthase subunit epsilon [Leucothrix pacifica]|nr:F0F1 ATP synthase subunit epsilon [Leucothrix pacifica]
MPANPQQADASTETEQSTFMHLEVMLPSSVFGRYDEVESVVLETPEGSFGLLPHRRDCVAALEPGILTYTQKGQATSYLAVDEGVMVKKGQQVRVSVRNAHSGDDLEALKQSVLTEFLSLSDKEAEMRSVLARLESGLMRGFKSLTS